MKVTRSSLLLLAAGVLSFTAWADVPIIPRPASEKLLNGSELTDYAALLQKHTDFVTMNSGCEINAAPELANELKHAKNILDTLPRGKGATTVLALDSTLPAEGYRMTVNSKGVTIEGGSPAGVFYGLQSLRQLITLNAAEKRCKIPFMQIEDAPTCEWRGVMLDSARHFQSKEAILRFIDAMATYKLNRFHWHLVDSEGWRMEIKKYPKLVEVHKDFPAEYPSEDPTDKSRPAKYMYGHFHGGGYYTQKDIREIVAYAKARHIEVMPEIAFPAHAMAALTAYPEFSTTKKVPTVRTNISPDLFAVSDEAIAFLKDILDETMELFPFGVIHFGGDEAPKGQWKNDELAQKRIKENGLQDENELQAWLFNQLAAHIATKGKRPAGWEEIMHGNNFATLTKSAIVYPWLSVANGIKSANEGHGVVHCAVHPFYMDSVQTHSQADNWSLYGGPFTLESLYKFNLFPGELTDEGRKNILGAQAQCWSELMTKPEHVEYQAYPRLTALAELTWTPPEKKDYSHFYRRLAQHPAMLDALKLNYRYINPLPMGTWDANTLSAGESFTLDIPATDAAKSTGEIVVELQYRSGSMGLDIAKVELLDKGKVIACDEHEGFTGTKSNDNSYRLKYKEKLSNKAQLRITHTNGAAKADSSGEVTLYIGDKAMQLFNPRNFRGGDHPSASWGKEDTAGASYELRVSMDGLIKKAGEYEFVLTAKDIAGKATIGHPRVQSTEGKGSSSKATAKLTPNTTQAFLPFSIAQSDVKAGNSLVLTLKQSKPYAGEVRVRPIVQLDTPAWAPANLGDGGTVIAYLKDMKAKRDGELKLRFRFTGGGQGIDIKSVQLVRDGRSITSDIHDGFAGGNPKNNEYSLNHASIKKGESYQLRLVISGSGGGDSRGTIEVE